VNIESGFIKGHIQFIVASFALLYNRAILPRFVKSFFLKMHNCSAKMNYFIHVMGGTLTWLKENPAEIGDGSEKAGTSTLNMLFMIEQQHSTDSFN
jgi:hypothetical protein